MIPDRAVREDVQGIDLVAEVGRELDVDQSVGWVAASRDRRVRISEVLVAALTASKENGGNSSAVGFTWVLALLLGDYSRLWSRETPDAEAKLDGEFLEGVELGERHVKSRGGLHCGELGWRPTSCDLAGG